MTYEHGGDIYSNSDVRDFSANINFRGMPDAVKKAALAAVDQSVNYPDPDDGSLRRLLARRECRVGGYTDILPEHILCANGATEIIYKLVEAFRPTHAFIAEPSFSEYERALSLTDCSITRFFLNPYDGFLFGSDFLDGVDAFIWEIETICMNLDTGKSIADLHRATGNGSVYGSESESGSESGTDDSEKAVRPRAMVILANPNNPTGRLIKADILQSLISLCKKAHILLVLDESFTDFLCTDDKKKTFSGAAALPDNPYIFVIRSFTKIYALPGIRFGYGICSDASLLQRMKQIIPPWNVSLVAQQAASAAAVEYEFAEESAQLTAHNRTEMTDSLKRAGYQVFPSCANFILLKGPKDLDAYCLKRGFLIRNCDNFPGLEKGGYGQGYFRICIRSHDENKELLEVLYERAGRIHKNK